MTCSPCVSYSTPRMYHVSGIPETWEMYGWCLPTRRYVYGSTIFVDLPKPGIDSGDKLLFRFKRRWLDLQSDPSQR